MDLWGAVGGATHRDNFADFMNGKVVFYFGGSWSLYQHGQRGGRPLRLGGGRRAVRHVVVRAHARAAGHGRRSSTRKQPELAARFLAFLAREDNMRESIARRPNDPGRRPRWCAPAWSIPATSEPCAPRSPPSRARSRRSRGRLCLPGLALPARGAERDDDAHQPGAHQRARRRHARPPSSRRTSSWPSRPQEVNGGRWAWSEKRPGSVAALPARAVEPLMAGLQQRARREAPAVGLPAAQPHDHRALLAAAGR